MSVVVSIGVSVGASNRSTAASVCFGARCEYLTVMPMVLWPRSSCTVRISTRPSRGGWQTYDGDSAS